MWNPFTPKTDSYTQQLEMLVEQLRFTIHQQQTLIAMLQGQPPPGPLPPLSRRPLPLMAPQPHRVRGAEDVSVLDRAQRRERDLKAEVAAVPLPEYMKNQRPPSPSQVPEGKNVGGGFSAPSPEAPQNPLPGELSTTSSSSKPPS